MIEFDQNQKDYLQPFRRKNKQIQFSSIPLGIHETTRKSVTSTTVQFTKGSFRLRIDVKGVALRLMVNHGMRMQSMEPWHPENGARRTDVGKLWTPRTEFGQI